MRKQGPDEVPTAISSSSGPMTTLSIVDGGRIDPGCEFDLIVSYYGPIRRRFGCTMKTGSTTRAENGMASMLCSASDRNCLISTDISGFRTMISKQTGRRSKPSFANMRRFDLHVAQPALTLDSYYTHLPFLRCKSFEFRLVDKIEVMAPCIRADIVAEHATAFRTLHERFRSQLLVDEACRLKTLENPPYSTPYLSAIRGQSEFTWLPAMLGSGRTPESELPPTGAAIWIWRVLSLVLRGR